MHFNKNKIAQFKGDLLQPYSHTFYDRPYA